MLPLRFIDRLKFFIERQFVRGASFQLLVVGLVIGLISVTGGLLVAPLGEPFDHLGSAVWWAFLRLTDPGYLGDDAGNWQRFVSTLLTLSGYVVFLGALVAILTRWLIAVMSNLERGLTPVALKHHVVVLGWSSLTLPLIAELLGSSQRVRRFLELHDARRLQLVVLTEEASARQVLELRNEPGIGSKARQVILRSGLPIQPDALHRVACLDAAAVIIPGARYEQGSLITSDVETVKALLSIAAQARQQQAPLPFVVAEVQDLRKRAVIEKAYPGAVEVVAGDATLSRLVVQTVRNPGLSELYTELLTASKGNQLYLRSAQKLAGMTLGELACQRPSAIVLGLLRRVDSGWETQLLAPPASVIAADDRVVLLARSYDDTEASPAVTPLRPLDYARPRLSAPSAAAQKRVLVLGWSRKVPVMLAEFGSYRTCRFSIDVVSVVPASQRQAAAANLADCLHDVQVQHLEADYMVESELRGLQPGRYDSIILLSSDRLATGEEADARAMMGYLLLDDILGHEASRPQVVLELSDPDNEHLLGMGHAEMLISPMIMSHVLAQVALRRELRLVLDELFTEGGAEFQFRDPEDYPLPASIDFAGLEKILAGLGERVVGVYRQRPGELGRHLQLNPPRQGYLDLVPGDRLVVLAETG